MTDNQDNQYLSLSLGLSNAAQHAVVGYAMISEEFCIKCKEFLLPEWFENIYVANIYDQLIKFHNEFKVLPRSEHELLSSPFFRSLPQDELKKYFETARFCAAYRANFNLNVLREVLSRFVRVVKSRGLAKHIVVNLNKQNYDSVISAAEKIAQTWRENLFDPPKTIDFSDTVSMWIRDDVEKQKLSTGSKLLDEMLGGGLEVGGNLAVLAPTFTGKSRFLLTLARHLMVQNKKVLYMFHEDSPDRVKERLISSMVGIGAQELKYVMKKRYLDLFDNVKANDAAQYLSKLKWPNPNLTLEEWDAVHFVVNSQLNKAREILEKNLIFMPWQKAGNMFVEDVLAEIRRIHLEEQNKTGKGLDVIIDDYPALLRSKVRHEHERARLSYVYQCFNDIAAELGAFCAYAVQINRQAARAMKKGEAETAIGLEDVSESYQIAMNAMAAISLNRSIEDANANLLRIAVVKARDAQAHGLMVTRTNYHHGSLFGDVGLYKDVGLFLISGLKSYVVNGHDISSTPLTEKTLIEMESQLNQNDLVLRSQLPPAVRSLLQLNITSIIESSVNEVKLEKPEAEAASNLEKTEETK